MSKAYQAKQPITRFDPAGVADRAAATANGTTVAMQTVSSAILATGAIAGRAVTKLVAASNASAGMLAAADYVCDGVADQVEINAAITALITTTGGTVLLSEGTFTLAGPVIMSGSGKIVLRGMGMGATVLQIVAAGGAPINTNIVQLNGNYCAVSDLTVDGNKANNATATGMILVNVVSNASPRVERVRMLNSALHGIVVNTSVSNGVVRDCLIEGSANHNAIFRAATGQPLVVSGCTSKGSVANNGIVCDSGPVTLSDCQALSNAGYGFQINAGTSPVTLTNCLAQSGSWYGYQIEAGTSRVRLIGCQAITNVNIGINTLGTQAHLIGCLATGTTGEGRGFVNSGVDTLYTGCTAVDLTGAGFYQIAATSRAHYVGCQTINIQTGFQIANGAANIEGCYIYGGGAAKNGVGVHLDSAGGNHLVHGCRIMNNGYDGIWVGSPVSNVQITNNSISDSSLTTNGAAKHITVVGDRVHIDGNLLRDPAAGNRPLYGIRVDGPSDNSYIGLNDTYGTGIGGEISDSGLNTLRIAKLQLDYTATSDLIAGTSIPTGVWADIGTNQTFRVDAPSSIIEISCWGSMQFGGAGVCQMASRLVIDSGGTPIYKKLGGEATENTLQQNPLTGAHPVNLTGLAVGAHTVKLQIVCLNVASLAWLRAASFAPYEFLNIQVTEFLL
jgi:hypothetical protein